MLFMMLAIAIALLVSWTVLVTFAFIAQIASSWTHPLSTSFKFGRLSSILLRDDIISPHFKLLFHISPLFRASLVIRSTVSLCLISTCAGHQVNLIWALLLLIIKILYESLAITIFSLFNALGKIDNSELFIDCNILKESVQILTCDVLERVGAC